MYARTIKHFSKQNVSIMENACVFEERTCVYGTMWSLVTLYFLNHTLYQSKTSISFLFSNSKLSSFI